MDYSIKDIVILVILMSIQTHPLLYLTKKSCQLSVNRLYLYNHLTAQRVINYETTAVAGMAGLCSLCEYSQHR